MNRQILTMVLVIAAELGGAGARADDDSYRPVDADVTRVETGCRWKDGERSGRYRAVVRTRCSPEHCYDDLFLEWLEDRRGASDTFRPTTTLAAKKRVEEVGGVANVSNLRFLPSGRQPQLEVEQSSIDVDKPWTICLALAAPGKYAMKKGRCRRAG
jgi:hypothetical protein